MSDKKRVNLLFQSDDNFAFMVGVAVASLLKNASATVFYDIYIFELKYSEASKQKFNQLHDEYPGVDFRITFIDASGFEAVFRELGVQAHRGSYVTYFKLLLDRVFMDTDVDRILHVGADTLITGSLEGLADFDFEGMPFAMNWNEKLRDHRYPRGIRSCIAEMVYFNLPVWRSMRCEERILTHIKQKGDIYSSKDQSILNIEFSGEYAQLPLKYNVYSMAMHFSEGTLLRFNNAPVLTKQEILEAYESPEIIHYARSFMYRPCEEDSTFIGKELWWDYCEASPWRGMAPIKPNPPLGAKEMIFRWMYQKLPVGFCDQCYIYSRRLYAIVTNRKYRPIKPYKIGALSDE